jgi:oligopeptide/dipeptide ABC transporter ATP-binding protein
MTEPLLRVENLVKHYPVEKGIMLARTVGHVRAVDGVSFSIEAGATLGLVGESGCGKTTTSRLVLKLETPTSGQVLLEGRSVHDFRGEAERRFRAAVQAVFQDPWASLNPRMTVGRIIAESLVVNRLGSRQDIDARVDSLLEQVGLRPEHARHYPHEFSGGQRQRVALASALAPAPRLIVLDEPVSALDVSIRAQMMNLLKDIQDESQVAYLLVAHDLATVRYMAHQVAVMYLGQIVEYAPTEELFDNVQHPYTKALFSAVLPDHPDKQHEQIELLGEVPSPMDMPAGCRFHTRCPFAMPHCAERQPQFRATSPGHLVACHLYEDTQIGTARGAGPALTAPARDAR